MNYPFEATGVIMKIDTFPITILTCTVFVFPSLALSADKTHPINCTTAEGDLRAMEAEKEHAEQQQLLDVTAVVPAGALLGLIEGNEGKKLQVLSGVYVELLNQRISKTKKTCEIK